MAGSVLRVIYTDSSKLPGITLAPGNLVFVEDTRAIQFVNSDNELTNYQNVVSLNSETGREALSHPYPALYWIKDTNVLWKYDAGDGWFQLTSTPKDQIVFSNREDFPAVGEFAKLYVDGTKMYRYINDEYEEITGGGGGSLDWLPINN